MTRHRLQLLAKKALVASLLLISPCSAYAVNDSQSEKLDAAINALDICIYRILLSSAPYLSSSKETRGIVSEVCRVQISKLNSLRAASDSSPPKFSLKEQIDQVPEPSQSMPAKYLIDRAMKKYDEAVAAIRQR